MKIKFLYCAYIILSALFYTTSHAQSFELKWANSLSANVSDIAIDQNNYVFAVGSFSDTVDFDPSASVSELIADSIYSNFLAIYDEDGLFQDAILLPGNSNVFLDLDTDGNIWVTGRFSFTADFDPGIGIYELTAYTDPQSVFPGKDCYIAKYNDQVELQFAFVLIDSLYSSTIEDIQIDDYGNAYFTGNFSETVNFNPLGNPEIRTTSNYRAEPFLAKYRPNGTLAFVHHLINFQSKFETTGYKVSIDQDQNVFLAGSSGGQIKLDPTSTNFITGFEGIDGFIAKYDSSGIFQFGGVFDGICRAMQTTQNGDLYVGGTMPDSMDADLGPNNAILYSSNNFDIWLAHYNANGEFISAKAFENNNFYHTYDFYINRDNDLLMSGYIRDTADFAPGMDGGELYAGSSRDIFVAKFDSDCQFLNGMTFGSTGNDVVDMISGNGRDNFWICGSFAESVDFDPSENEHFLSLPNGVGSFIAMYKDPDILGLKKLESTELLPVYIYSFENSIYIDFSELSQVDAQIQVYTLSGTLIKDLNHSSSDLLQIPIDGINSQIYLVQVQDANAILRAKVLLTD